jgi:glycosyltransferase involved in cell wall biosynthesis
LTENNIKKRVVFFDFVTSYGGAQQSTVSLCGRLKKVYDVYVIDAYGHCEKYLDGLSQFDVPVRVLIPDAEDLYIGHANKPLRRIWSAIKQLPTLWTLRKRLAENVRDIRPGLVWTTSHKALLFLALSSSVSKCAVAIYALGWFGKFQVPWIGRWLIKNRTDGILAISNPTKQALKSWGVRGDKIHTAYDAVDIDTILAQSRLDMKPVLPGANSDFKILVPARLLRTKGQHTAIKAAALLDREGFDFVMWLSGDVAVGDKSGYIDYLKKLIVENELEEKVFLLGWQKNIRDLMVVSDVVMLPTHTEGLPHAVLEAMVLKRPVVTTPVGGIPDLVVDGETGLLFPVDDEKALSSCLQRLINDKDFGRSLAEKAHRHVCEKFHPDRQIDLVLEAFERVMADKKAKG